MSEDSGEFSRVEQLRTEVSQLERYAQEQAEKGFVWVYRGETVDPDEDQIGQHQRAQAGTWFTPKFGFAQQHAEKLKGGGAKNTRIVAVVIPKSMLDSEEQIKQRKGRMPVGGEDTVQIAFRPDLVERVADGQIEEIPSADTYISQFKIAQELQSTT